MIEQGTRDRREKTVTGTGAGAGMGTRSGMEAETRVDRRVEERESLGT